MLHGSIRSIAVLKRDPRDMMRISNLRPTLRHDALGTCFVHAASQVVGKWSISGRATG